MEVDYLVDVVEQFFEFAREVHENVRTDFQLALNRWIDEGHAIELTGGDFATFLRVVILILKRVEERGLVDPDPDLRPLSGELSSWFREEYWRANIFQRKQGMRALSRGSAL